MSENKSGVTLAVFSDTHCGSTEGLMKPRQYQFRDGNVSSNKRQKALWRVFLQYADEIAQRRQGRKLVVCINGDLVDGDHHDTHQLVTRKSSEQERLFLDVWDEFAKITGFGAGDEVYVLRGTDLNGSHGAMDSADVIARDIEAIPEIPPKLEQLPEFEEGERKKSRAVDGWFPWQRLDLEIYGHLVQITHHPPAGKGRRAHTNGNALRSWLRSYQQQLDARRMKIPRYLIFSHLHTFWSEPMRLDNGRPDAPLSEAVILPAFQGKTDFVEQKISMSLPTTIGGWWAQFDPDGITYSRGEFVELTLEQKARKV